MGTAFASEMERSGVDFYVLSRKELDYTKYGLLEGHLRQARPSFVINAAGFTGRPNVDACESARAETLLGNTLFPQTLAQACAAQRIPWGHISSGCIYSGAKVAGEGAVRIEPDLSDGRVRRLLRESPGLFTGFSELDPPNFSFRSPPCSFYSGSKALAEEVMEGVGEGYLWRLRIPFDHEDNPRNFLTKVQTYSKVYDNVNSISHRHEFARACLALWQRRAPFGIYNVTNPGWITTRQVIEQIQKILQPRREFEFWENDAEFYARGAKAPRSNCIMDCSKLLAAGVKMRPVEEALDEALRHWRVAPPAA